MKKALSRNPSFTLHSLLESPVPFLYAKATDAVIRAGDALFHYGTPYEIVSLNAKKQECVIRPFSRDEGTNEGRVSLCEFKPDSDSLVHIPQPGKEAKRLITILHAENFYRHPDSGLKERYYPLHLRLAVSCGELSHPAFILGGDGKLLIKELHGYSPREKNEYLNPYTIECQWAMSRTAGRASSLTMNQAGKSRLLLSKRSSPKHTPPSRLISKTRFLLSITLPVSASIHNMV